jgi:hypothetical protein
MIDNGVRPSSPKIATFVEGFLHAIYVYRIESAAFQYCQLDGNPISLHDNLKQAIPWNKINIIETQSIMFT